MNVCLKLIASTLCIKLLLYIKIKIFKKNKKNLSQNKNYDQRI